MRLFIAVDFNEAKDYLTGLQEILPKNAKLSLAKSFHLTLKFLGEVSPDKADDAILSLKNVKFEPFTAFTESIGIFPTENYIRVVWVGLKPEEKIIELQGKIDEALKPMFKKEKDFKAHITLARVKHPEDKKLFIEQLKRIKVELKKIDVITFKLIRSTLTPKGPVYEDVEVFPLLNQ